MVLMITSTSKLIDLSNKTTIVTGGASGIGEGIVRRLHDAGCNIVIADINEQLAHNLADELSSLRPNSVYVVRTDVSSQSDLENLVNKTIEVFGKLDNLVNNAGIYPMKNLADLDEELFMRVININLKGSFLACKLAAEVMKKQGQGGKIINITSIDALHPSMAGLSHYDASKHGLWGFTKNIALELAEHKIWVNAIAPGGINTPGATPDPSTIPAGVDMSAMKEQFLQKIPMHRMGEPDDIGRAVLFLASDLASYITGTQIVVDGGALLK
jgi:2-deoxy-D-gluconate 3-dehydrogenase